MLPFHLGLLVGARFAGQVLSVDSHAVMLVRRAGPQPHRQTVVAAAEMGFVVISLFAVVMSVGLAGLIFAGISAAAALWIAAYLPFILLVVTVVVGMATTWGSARRGECAVTTLLASEPPGSILELHSFAAWPQRRGHGGRLLSAVLESFPPECSVVLAANTARLRAAYARLAQAAGYDFRPSPGLTLLITRPATVPASAQQDEKDVS